MIITKIQGGLGNQIFQYAAGRALAQHLQCPLKVDLAAYDDHVMHNGYELARFKLEVEVADREDVRAIAGGRGLLARQLRSKFGIAPSTHVVESSFEFDPAFFSRKAPLYLDGYWQSYWYAARIAKSLRSDLLFVEPASDRNQRLADTMMADSASVALHVRRGDYVSNQRASKVHGVLSSSYYRDALDYIRQRVAGLHVYVFSDEPEWVQENLCLEDPVTHVNHNTGTQSFEDLRLMTHCKHHVIANSSFSWWGAWLAEHAGQIVCFPEPWFTGGRHNTDELCPEYWIAIAREQ